MFTASSSRQGTTALGYCRGTKRNRTSWCGVKSVSLKWVSLARYHRPVRGMNYGDFLPLVGSRRLTPAQLQAEKQSRHHRQAGQYEIRVSFVHGRHLVSAAAALIADWGTMWAWVGAAVEPAGALVAVTASSVSHECPATSWLTLLSRM
jgi:hypothetical protein